MNSILNNNNSRNSRPHLASGVYRACAILLLTLTFLLFAADALLAQRRSSFGGSRSSSSSRPSYSSPSRSSGSSFGGSRSSSPSYSPSRPSYSSPSRSYSSGSSGGSSFGTRRSSPSVSVPSRSYSPNSGGAYMGGNMNTRTKSYGIPRKESYGGQTYSYRGNTNGVAVNRSTSMIPRNYSYSYNDVYSRRNSYYSGLHFAPPSYIGYTSPSYGMFSTLFMLSALQNLQAQQNAMFFYNHWNTPSMMAWRNDMNTAAQSDAQAAQRIRDLEARVQQMEREKSGLRDTTYMPAGVDSSVVLSNEALGVKNDDDDNAEAAAARSGRREREESSGGGGFLWVLLIGGGVGAWWFIRRNKKARESENTGSFS